MVSFDIILASLEDRLGGLNRDHHGHTFSDRLFPKEAGMGSARIGRRGQDVQHETVALARKMQLLAGKSSTSDETDRQSAPISGRRILRGKVTCC